MSFLIINASPGNSCTLYTLDLLLDTGIYPEISKRLSIITTLSHAHLTSEILKQELMSTLTCLPDFAYEYASKIKSYERSVP